MTGLILRPALCQGQVLACSHVSPFSQIRIACPSLCEITSLHSTPAFPACWTQVPRPVCTVPSAQDLLVNFCAQVLSSSPLEALPVLRRHDPEQPPPFYSPGLSPSVLIRHRFPEAFKISSN